MMQTALIVSIVEWHLRVTMLTVNTVLIVQLVVGASVTVWSQKEQQMCSVTATIAWYYLC